METSFLFFVTLLLLIINSSSSTLFNISTDKEALLAFKKAITVDTSGVLSNNWLTNTSICGWAGVSCGARHHRVSALDLSGHALAGSLSPHLGNLTFLQSLDISYNSFTGVLPSELANLRRLREIDVGFNDVAGEIPPWLGALFRLQHLRLNNNRFSGGIPLVIFTNMSLLMEIDVRSNMLSGLMPENICGGGATELRLLDLSENRLGGEIPAGIYKCRKLERLNMSVNGFTGKIPTGIGNLTMLRILHIQANFLEGEIPSSVFNISSLEFVNLINNSMSGSIPILYNSPNLEDLYLSSNNLTGSIPKEIGNLNKLKNLVLTANHLTGPIPKQVGNLTSLMSLDLAYNKLTGELPEEIGNLAQLRIFGAPFNDFLNGSIPSSIFNLSRLQILGLQHNQFSGTLPPNMGASVVNLQILYLNFNRLTGEIPSSITNASQLTVIELGRNLFTGFLPDFGNLRQLQFLRLWNNNLTGAAYPDQELTFISSLTNCRYLTSFEISNNQVMNGILPASVGNLSASLIRFAASNCSIRGAIPSEIGNLVNLTVLDLSLNRITGSIPATLGKMKQLAVLYLDENLQLQGSIPYQLCQISGLLSLFLNDNMLTGSIPECLGGLKFLESISFASNNLNSTLPSNFLNLPYLINMDLSSNYLSGQLPSQIGGLTAINYLNLSSNMFVGNIPNTIVGCQSLEDLFLSNNMLNGSIPESLVDVKGLRNLDLSNNTLSGVIPDNLEKLRLESLNVSHNKLEGKIPDEGCFANFTFESFVQNSDLCGPARLQLPPCLGNGVRSRSRSKTVSHILKYALAPFIAAVILVVIIFFLIMRRRQRGTPASADVSSVGASWKIISERELIRGTNSFSEMNLLGKGSFGSVFKAILANETDVFAVKVFNLELEGALKSFDTESRILSTVRHRNLIRIHGCCSNEQFKALILAYMPNGSLEKWLHSDSYVLDMMQRLDIAIDVALGLEYLHHNHTFTVVHCDIKPNNVLLDEDMTARVGDFGISKLFEDRKAMIHTKTMATIGYAAPEYGSEGKVSTNGDVYSYGILVLEMFTGKRPTDDMFSAEMGLKEWVGKAIEQKAIEQKTNEEKEIEQKAIEQKLMSEVMAAGLLSREDRHFSAKLECVKSVFDLAMKCLAFSPEERMNMMQVAAALHKIKATLEAAMKRQTRSSR